MRGTIEGGLWGLVVGSLGLSVASLATAPPAGAPSAQIALVAPSSESETSTEIEAETVVAAPVVEQETPPAEQAVPEPLQEPTTENAFLDVINTTPPALTTDVTSPPLPADLDPVPETPDVAQPPVVLPALDPLLEPSTVEAPEIDTTPAEPPVPETPAPEPETVAPVTAGPLPQIEVAQVPETEIVPAPQTETAQAPQTEAEQAPQIIAPEGNGANIVQAQSAAPSRGGPVRINRPGADTDEAVAEEEVAAVEEEEQTDLPALAEFAAVFENTDDLSVISVILIDEGVMPDGAAAIADLGFAPTIVINALDDDAATRMEAYRAAGAEVAMQIALPDGAQPTDVEVAFAAAFGILPEVAMLFSDGTGVLQNNRSVTGQVMEVLAAGGHGFVTVRRGLGNAARAAAQNGVPAVTIDRELDADGENSAAIGRALDQAAFRARQSGGAVLMGRLQGSTIAALRDWAATAGDDGVAPAPVSAGLLGQGG